MLVQKSVKCANFSTPDSVDVEALLSDCRQAQRQIEQLNGILTLAHRATFREFESVGCDYDGDIFAVLAGLDATIQHSQSLLEFVDEKINGPILQLAQSLSNA